MALAVIAAALIYLLLAHAAVATGSARNILKHAIRPRQTLRLVATVRARPLPGDPNVPPLPFSVVPGGVRSESQFARELANHPLVAAQYAGFQLRKFHFVRLRRGRMAYVSYRLGNHLYWTDRKIALFAGEFLFTDGTLVGRARCGNRVSEIPRQPTSPSQPPTRLLETPIAPLLPGSLHPPPITNIAFLPPSTGTPTSSGILIPPIILIPPGGGTGLPPTSPTPLLPTPEPDTLTLVSAGLAAWALLYLLYGNRR